jgi:hypothetical protein
MCATARKNFLSLSPTALQNTKWRICRTAFWKDVHFLFLVEAEEFLEMSPCGDGAESPEGLGRNDKQNITNFP